MPNQAVTHRNWNYFPVLLPIFAGYIPTKLNLSSMEQIGKDKKNSLLINLLCFVTPMLVLGIWMILDTSKQEHQSIEKATVYFVKEIWGSAAGLTLLILGLITLLLSLFQYKRKGPSKPKPVTLGQVIFSISSTILLCTTVVYAVILAQYFLADSGTIPKQFGFGDMGMIGIVCITFMFCFGLSTLISWLATRKRK
jgi:hypothetical protein